MMVVVAGGLVAAIAETPDARKLHQILNYACEGRHVVVFDPPDSVTTWLNQVDAGTRSAYETALRLSSRRATALPAEVATVRIDLNAPQRWEDPLCVLGLDAALNLLSEPLGILVENSGNDWHFLKGLMRVSEREFVSEALTRGWAQILHGGGANLPAQINIRLAGESARLRTFVLFDSDRRHPDELAHTWVPTAPEACAGFVVEQIARVHLPRRYWMLRRRYIESYLPRAELEGAVSPNVDPGAVAAFFRMSEPSRWYFNMKQGFHGDEPVENRHRCRDLYDHVSAEDRQALHRGFGRIAGRYAEAETRAFDWDTATRSEAATAMPELLRLL